MEPYDFIDPDEGYRDTDWDSHLDPFYTEALPCESCGRPCTESELKIADWDPDLRVGPCCYFSLNLIPDLPICETLWPNLEHCTSVEEVARVMNEHVKTCPVCGAKRKAIVEEIPVSPDRKAA
jgi:hypothetical protein